MRISRLLRGARALAVALVIAFGVVASMPADAFANCGPNRPWPTCKKAVPSVEPQPAQPLGSQGAEPGVLGYVWLIIAALGF
jgi:hypothetical protein